jgi:Na+-driven multidrug efflux pump
MNYFASIGMPMIVVYSPGMATILNIVLNMKLTPLLGIVGTSISSVIAYGLMMIFSLVYIYVQRRDHDR